MGDALPFMPWHESRWDWGPETAEQCENFPGEKWGQFRKRGDPTWEVTNKEGGKVWISLRKQVN